MLKKIQTIKTSIFFILIAFFLVVGLIVPDRKMSDQENRTLATFPDFTLERVMNGKYFSELSDYISDQFLFRDQFMTMKVKTDKLVGKKESGGVYLGHKGYLLAKNEEPDKEALNNSIKAINAFTAKHAESKMMIVPSAGTINPSLLPYGAPMRDQIKDIQDFTKQLTNIKIIDTATSLKKYKNEYLYYKTDHHWTTQGAYREYQNVASQLGIEKPSNDFKKYIVSNSFEGTLASESGDHSHQDEIQIFAPKKMDVQYYVKYVNENKMSTSVYDSSKLDTKDQYTVFFGGNHPVVEINTTNTNHKNLLIIKDSYANSFVPFLIPYYSKIIMVDPRYYYDDINKLIDTYNINQYLFLYSANTILKDTSLADLLNSN
ncbi:MAG: DHHW family protein [Sharpea porci]|uniref:DHHW family protein n=1 Tax=Sharpea porci TaxID=2652286 RepID=UPI00240920D8|nr:DHHW family protein [Sharpea porci]MDD6712379.1 DHHW family protein [Sharpea porci]